MATNYDLRASTRSAGAGWRVVLLALAAGLSATLLLAGSALLGGAAERPAFLADKLGATVAGPPRHETAAGDRVELPRSGYVLRSGGRTVAVASADESGSAWRTFERGAVRATPFGEETVVVHGEVVEQFLTVTERTGPKRWRWRLDTGALEPTSRPDGSVLVAAGNIVAGFRILPAAVLDADGDDVTPAGTRWELERRNGGWWLALDLDDRGLPLPYVIDPATMALRGIGATNTAGATTLDIPKPSGLAVDDQMVAQVTVRGGTGTYVCPPAGWTSVRRVDSGTALAQALFRKTATSTDVAAASFAFTLDDTAGCASPLALKASGGIVATYGVDNSNPISAENGQANAASANIVAPSITPNANEIVLGFFGTARGTTITPPAGTPTFTEQWDEQSTGGGPTTRTTSQLSTALSPGGATGTKTAVAAAGEVNIGQLVSLRLDTTSPSAPSVVLSESDADTHVTGTTLYYRAGGDGGSFDVTVTSSDGQSGLKHVAFPALGAGFSPTSVTNDTSSPYAQSYSWSGGATESGAKAVTAEDNATNQSTGSFTITADNAVPSGGALTVNGTAATGAGSTSTSGGSFSIVRTDYADGGSGLASSTLTRDSAPYANDVCGAFSGSPTVIVGAPAQNLGAGCYRYVLTGTDNVGNAVSLQTDVLVHGAAGQLALSGSTADLTSGATRVLTATVQDTNGNTVVSDSSTVVAFAQSSGAGTVTGAGTATASSGVATKAVAGALAGSVTMQAAAAGLTAGTLGAFTVVHGAATQVALSGSAADLASGTTRLLTATIQDAAGNTVTSDSSTVVTFSKQSGAGTVTGLGTVTAANGVATRTVTGGVAGSVTMEASAGGLATGTLGAFTVVPGVAAQLQLSGSTADLPSGTTRVLTATILDAGGNTLTGDNSTVVTFGQQSGTGTVTGAGAATASSGVATKTVTGALAGSVTMEATAAGLTTGTMGAFTVVPGAAAQIELAGATTDLVSGADRVLTATIQDAAGNTVTSDSSTVVAFAQSGGTGTVTGTGNATAANGVATKTVVGRFAGSVTMEATAAGLGADTLGALMVVHGPAAQIELGGETTDLASGATRVLTATIQDAAGNTVTSDSSTVVAFAQSGGTGTVTGAGDATAANGVATKTVTGALAGAIDLEATSAGLSDGTLSFAVVHGAAAQLALSGSTADLASGASRVLSATLKDAAGNVVAGDSSTVVSFGQASGLGSVTGLGSATASNGVATKSVSGALAGTVDLEATAAGLSAGTLAFVVVPGAAAQIRLTGATADLVSGASRVLTATLQDAAGNTVTADSATVVAFGKSAGAATVTGLGNATAAGGVAAKTVSGALAGAITLEATAAGLAGDTISFDVVHGAAAQLELTGATTELPSGADRVLTATLQDAAGNAVTSDSATVVTFAQQSGPGTLTGLGNVTASNGVAATAVTGGLAGAVVVEATADPLIADTISFSVVAGGAVAVELTGSTADLASGDDRVLTARLVDAQGNTVTSDSSTSVSFGQAAGTGTVTGLGTATASAGVATKTVTGALAGPLALAATASGLTADTIAFDVVHGAAATVELAGSTADLASGANRALTATVRDAAGNTVTSDGATVVTFAKASGAGTVTGLGTATASGGVATKSVTGALAGALVLEATAAGLTDGTLSFDVVHGGAAQLELGGATTDLVSGVTRVLTATVRDAAGNAVTSDSSTVVTFAKQSGAGTVTGSGTATAANGVATKTITGDVAGAVTMIATAAGLADGTLGTFTVVHGAAARVELTASTADLASGTDRVLTATLVDAAGNTVFSDSSTLVTFARAAGTGSAGGLGGAGAANGVATKTVTGALAGPITVEATATGLSADTLAFEVVHGAAASIDVSGATTHLASGSDRILTATIRDAAGNTVTSDSTTVIAFGKQSGLGSVTGLGNAGAANGVATKTVTGELAGPIVVGAGAGALTPDTLSFDVVHGAAAQIELTESGSTVAGDAHTLTATIRDPAGNTVTGDSSTVVAFAKTGGPGTVSGLGTATAANGVATKAVTNRLAGQIDLDAQATGLATGTASYTIAVGPVSPAASDSTLDGVPGAVYANGIDTATLTVTLRDAGGNPISGKAVSLDQGGGGSTITGGGTTNASGVVTFQASNASVETVTYTATDTTDSIVLADDATVDFTFADATPPTNTITLLSPSRAWLDGTDLWYNGAAGGSFSLWSAVADGGSGPASAGYPALARPGWTYGGETVTTPAGGPYASSGFTFAPGAGGDFTYAVTAADAWSPANTSTTLLEVKEDSTAPAASILCDGSSCPAGWSTTTPVSVTLAAPDAGAGLDQIRHTTDGTDPTIFTGTVYLGAFDVAAQGVTTVKYRAFDRVGNDTGVLTQTIRIDTIAPDTTVDSVPDAATQDTTPTFAFGSPDGGISFEVRLDGGSWSAATSPLTLGPLAESTYTFEVRATDQAGNVDASPASFVFTVDTTAANTTITSAPAAATSSTNASFSFTASDAGPGFECRLDGGAWSACTSPKAYSGLTETPHTFEVRAKDAAGNVDATPDSHDWTIDLTAPDTSFLSTPADPSANRSPTFSLGSNESPVTFECNLDGGGWAPCATPYTAPSLGDGAHTLEARASDAAGNQDASEAEYGWVVDATAPTGSVTAPLDGASVGGTVALASDSADAGGTGVAGVTFQRSPATAGTWTSQAPSWDTTLVADGDYDLRVVTVDNAGNSFTSPAVTVTVDNTEPALSVVAPNPVNLATADPATISASATDDGTGVANVRFDQCAEDSPACGSDSWVLLALDTGAPYSASWPIPSDGTRLLRVRATDNAGRQTTELVLVTVDRSRPSGSVTAPAAGTNLRGDSVALAATASDAAPGTVNTVTFQVSAAGAGTWTDVATDSSAPYGGTLDTTALADGLYDLRVFTTDAAGNAEATPATIQVRVDNTDPTGSVTAPGDGADVRGTVALASDAADSGSGVATVQFQRSPAGAGSWTNEAASFDTTAVADGLHDLRVRTTDNAGNVFTSAAVTIRVDNTLPTGSVTAPAAGANLRGTVTLTSDAADSGSGVATVQFQRSPAGAGSWTNEAASFDTTAVADGLHDLRVRTTDNAGNVFTSDAVTVRVDNTLPTGSITAPANGAEIGVAPVTLTSDSADAGSGVATVVFERSPAGAGAWTSTPASWDTASGPHAVADGLYDLRVLTTDEAGNVFASPTVTVLVDHTAPTTIASLAPGSPSNAPVTVSFSADDGTGSGVSVVSHRIDGGSLQSGAAVIVPAPGDHSNDGAHLVEFFSTDEVGNVEALQSVTVVIDTTAPSGSGGDPGDYLRGIAALSYSTVATDVSSVQFQFSPAGAGAWTNVGGADLAPPYEASWNTGLVGDGEYDLRAVVTDTTGNVANTLLPGLPKTVDNTAPSASVAAPLAGAFVSATVAVDASASDGAVPPASGVSAVRFEVKPSGGGAFTVFGTQTAPLVGSTYREALDTTALADGPAELRVVVTDVAGNETTSPARTVTVDNDSPVVTLDDPGAAVGASVDLAATSSADTASVDFRFRPVGSGGAGTPIGTDATSPFGVTWTTAPAAEGTWELIAVATDAGGNTGTSAPRTVLVDRTQPSGSVTAPAASAIVGGPTVALAAAAADAGGSGVVRVDWEVRPFGSAAFATVATDADAPYTGTWDSTSAAAGAAEIRALITDAAGNTRTTAVVGVTVDSTGPTVALADPGAVLSGTVALSAGTGGGAARVVFSISPADAGSWTQIAEDASAPFGADFDTAALADGLYDLRAIGYDALGNPSAPSVREDVRLDNTAPELVSSAPADGSTSVSATEIVLTASEPVTAVAVLLDGAPAPAPAIAGSQLTFPTGALADGLHVLEGELEDASGTRVPFRVAVTIVGAPTADPPPVERNVTSAGDWELTVPGGLVRVRMPQAAWPTPPTPSDFILVLRVDAGPVGGGFAPGTQIADVSARWALAGTPVTDFDAPIEIVFSNPTGVAAIPAHSPDAAAWQPIPPLDGPLPAAQPDGFTRAGSDVHVWTRHLTYFGLLLDDGPPTAPRDLAGVVADDGLTLRWVPGTDASGQLGNVILRVNGADYRHFGPTEFEAKLGPFAAGDTRSFTLIQKDAAGNHSHETLPLRALPPVAGRTLADARAALGAAGFEVGTVREAASATAVPGTIVSPSGVHLALAGTPVDLVVARAAAAPETRLVFAVAASKRLALQRITTVAARIDLTKPATVTVTLRDAKRKRLQGWTLQAQAGASIVRLRLPAAVRRPGAYTLTWVARARSETVSRTLRFTLLSPKAARAKPGPRGTEAVLAGTTPANRLAPGRGGMPRRVVSVSDAEEAFELMGASTRTRSVVVVDVDDFGARFIRDLRAVFPSTRVIAVSREPATRRLAVRAGAVRALPRSTPRAELRKAIAVAAAS